MKPNARPTLAPPVRYALAGLVLLYFAGLAVLTGDTVRDGDLFSTKLDRLTDRYVAYLAPTDILEDLEQARTWLAAARDDLRPMQHDDLLIGEMETWIDILSVLPPKAAVRLDRIPHEQNEYSRAFLRVEGMEPDAVKEMTLADYLGHTRPAFDAYLAKLKESNKLTSYFWNLDRSKDLDYYETSGFVLAIGFQKALYLSGIAPRWEPPYEYRQVKIDGMKVATVVEAMREKLKKIKSDLPGPGFVDAVEALLKKVDKADTASRADLLAKVNALRKDQAPQEARERIRFFGPLCLRRLLGSLTSENEDLRIKVWQLVYEITRIETSRDPDSRAIDYRPERQDNEDTERGRDEWREKRRAAVDRLLTLVRNLREGTGMLEPGLEYMY